MDIALLPATAVGGEVPRPPDPAPWQTWAGWGALGAGAVGLGLGAVFHANAQDGINDIDGLPKGERSRYDALDPLLRGMGPMGHAHPNDGLR